MPRPNQNYEKNNHKFGESFGKLIKYCKPYLPPIIVAILFGGGLFGFAGMLLGVPTFAVIYYIAQMLIESKLEQKNLPTNSRHYHPMSYVDEYGRFRYSKKKVYRKTKEEAEKADRNPTGEDP